MSRPTVVRRLTAVLALLAVLCLALPAAAAPGARGQSLRHSTVHATGLVDQLLAWLGSFLPVPSQGGKAPAEKSGAIQNLSGAVSNAVPQPPSNSDHSGMIDPNG